MTPLETDDQSRAQAPDASPPAQDADPTSALDAAFRAAKESQDTHYRALLRGAHATAAALDGWAGVRTAEDWERARERAPEAYDRGRFLLERLGAERELDPTLMAMLLHLRERMRAELAVSGAAEELLVDQALLAYVNSLRVQRWISDAGMLVEHALFGQSGPTAKLAGKHGQGAVAGLQAEDEVNRLTGALLPALDRLTRQFIRCLRAIRDLRGGSVALTVNQVAQLNVAQAQVNTATPPSDPPPARRRRRSPAPDRDADGREAGEVTP